MLAFTNMSGDVEQEYFSDGIADDIITELSRSRSLFVIARNSSFTYKGRAIDVKQVAHELGVRYVWKAACGAAVAAFGLRRSLSTPRQAIIFGLTLRPCAGGRVRGSGRDHDRGHAGHYTCR